MLVWGLVIGYLCMLFLAAVWAAVERIRSAMVGRERGLLGRALHDEPGEFTTPGEASDAAGARSGPTGALSVDAV